MRPTHFIEATIIEGLLVPSIGHNSINEDFFLSPRAVRLIADEQERRILEECAHADARARVREISPSIANQIWQSISKRSFPNDKAL